MKILSVDWDFFFPDQSDYDWAMDENKAYLYDIIWIARSISIDFKTKQKAIDIMIPDDSILHNFWSKVINNKPLRIIIADSHLILYYIIKRLNKKNLVITNFDAHHDCGYNNIIQPDCGNWVYFANRERYLKEYNLVYPRWRKDRKEFTPFFNNINYLNFEDIQPAKYDLLFICRSSCWTPSWSDLEWLKFIIPWLHHKNIEIWPQPRNKDWLLNPRPFDREQAEIMFNQVLELSSQLSQ